MQTLESISTLPEIEALAISVMAQAFATDPVMRWMYPDNENYQRQFPEFARQFAGKAFETETADYVQWVHGAALWLPPEVELDDLALGLLLQFSVDESIQSDLLSVFEQMEENRPREPHWRLRLIGVDPALQGNGLGSQLMQRGLRRCDHDGVPAYVESTNPRHTFFYERHGFRVVGKMQAGSSPVILPMVRMPRRS